MMGTPLHDSNPKVNVSEKSEKLFLLFSWEKLKNFPNTKLHEELSQIKPVDWTDHCHWNIFEKQILHKLIYIYLLNKVLFLVLKA